MRFVKSAARVLPLLLALELGRMQRFSGRQQEPERSGVGDDRYPVAGAGGDVHPLDVLRADGALGLRVDAAVGVQRAPALVRAGAELRAVRHGRGVVVGLFLFAAGQRGVHDGARCVAPTRTSITGASRSCSTPGPSRSSPICGGRRRTPTRSSPRFASRSTSPSRRSTTASSPISTPR